MPGGIGKGRACMEQHSVSITILGTRGSVSVSGKAFARYGGATTCALVHVKEQYIVVDAGTGLMSLPDEAMRAGTLPLLLTHPHIDHLLGFPLSPCAMRAGLRLDVYAKTRGGLDARAQFGRLIAPPLWPVEPEALPADIRFLELPDELSLGGVTVAAMEGRHPGGVSILRFEAEGKRVVFATDCTLTDDWLPALREFAGDCDLLLCDGQYSDEEWASRSAFGHSSWGYVARFAHACGAKRLRIIHHDPTRTDEQLDHAAEELRRIAPDYDFAKEGECICL